MPSREKLPDVYPFAAFLAGRFDCAHIVTIGCANMEGLSRLQDSYRIVGIDNYPGITQCRQALPHSTWLTWEIDQLEQMPLSERTLRQAVVVCARLLDGHELPLEALRKWMAIAPIGVITAPGPGHPPGADQSDLPVNGKDWEMQRFGQLLRAHGLSVSFIGYTAGDQLKRRKTAMLAVVENSPGMSKEGVNTDLEPPADFRVVAIMPVYNEEDIIVPSLAYLRSQGIQTYVIDNWSSDRSYELASNFLGNGVIGMEKFPPNGPSTHYDWRGILRRVESLTREELEASWFMLHDCDEVRRPPWNGITLREAIYRVQRAGYNCIDHSLIEFSPVDNDYVVGTDLEEHFKFFCFPARRAVYLQAHVWRNFGQAVTLSESAGHQAEFKGRRIYPYKFLIKHYPIRSQSHGEKKVFLERKTRFHPEERAIGWHNHYDHMTEGYSFVRDPRDLIAYDDELFQEEFLVERLSAVGAFPADDNVIRGV